MLSTLIVGNTIPLLQYVRQVIGEFDDICVYKVIEDSVSSHEFVRNLGTYEPDVTFIEIGADNLGECNRLIKDVYAHSSHTAVVGMATSDSENIRLAALSAGVKVVLTLPFSAEQLQQALFDSILPKVSVGAGRLTIMLPARPGSGATVVGWNAAHALATVFRKRVLFVDTDYYGSVVDEMLLPVGSAQHSGTILPSLDNLSWPRIALKIWPTLDVVPTSVVRQLVGSSRWELSRLVQIAKANYDFVLMRVARTSDLHVNIAMRQAERVCLVTSTDLASCTGALRRCRELTAAGVPTTAIHAVINRADTPIPKTLRDVEWLDIDGVVPDGRQAIHDAFEQFLGVMPQKSDFAKSIVGLCETLWDLTPANNSGGAWWKGGRKAS